MTDGGVVGDVVPGELLGPIVGLAFSADGALLFACCGSSVLVFSVRSGQLLLSQRIFSPGTAVSGLDIGCGGSSESRTALPSALSVRDLIFLCLTPILYATLEMPKKSRDFRPTRREIWSWC